MSANQILPRGTPNLSHPCSHVISQHRSISPSFLCHVSPNSCRPDLHQRARLSLTSEVFFHSFLPRVNSTLSSSWHIRRYRKRTKQRFCTDASAEGQREGERGEGESEEVGNKEIKGGNAEKIVSYFKYLTAGFDFFGSNSKSESNIKDGRQGASYYPRGFEYMKEEETVDWSPVLWLFAGLSLLFLTRKILLRETLQILSFCQLALSFTAKASFEFFRLLAKSVISLFPEQAILIARFADIIVSLVDENFSVLVDLLPPARQLALSSFMPAALIVAFADVVVPPAERTKVSKILGPAGVLGLASCLGMLHPVNLFLALFGLTGWMVLRWKVAGVTAVTPMVVTAVTLAEGEALKGLVMGGYVWYGLWSYYRRVSREEVEREGNEGSEEREGKEVVARREEGEKIEYPLVFKVVLWVLGSVYAYKWGLKIASQWQMV